MFYLCNYVYVYIYIYLVYIYIYIYIYAHFEPCTKPVAGWNSVCPCGV